MGFADWVVIPSSCGNAGLQNGRVAADFSRSRTQPGVSRRGLVKCPVLGSLRATAWLGFAVWSSLGEGFHGALAGWGPALGLPGTVLCQRAAIFWVTPGQSSGLSPCQAVETISTSLLCSPPVQSQHCRLGRRQGVSLSWESVQRAHTAASPVMQGDGQVLTTPAVTNLQLQGFTPLLDPPEDALSAADVATGVSCNVWLPNQSPSGRQNELAAHVCVSQGGDAIKKGIQPGTRPHLLPLEGLDAVPISSSNTHQEVPARAPSPCIQGREWEGFVFPPLQSLGCLCTDPGGWSPQGSPALLGRGCSQLLRRTTTNRQQSRAEPLESFGVVDEGGSGRGSAFPGCARPPARGEPQQREQEKIPAKKGKHHQNVSKKKKGWG